MKPPTGSKRIAYDLEVHGPVLGSLSPDLAKLELAPAWMEELWGFRGRVLYANGRRPSFRLAENIYQDADDHDLYSYHLVLRDPNTREVTACLRMLSLASPLSSRVEHEIGSQRVRKVLDELAVPRHRIVEAARWVVDPQVQGRGNGSALAAAVFSMSRMLGFELMWCTAGVRDGQSRLLSSFGFRLLPGTTLVASEVFADEMALMYMNVYRTSPDFERLVAEVSPWVQMVAQDVWPNAPMLEPEHPTLVDLPPEEVTLRDQPIPRRPAEEVTPREQPPPRRSTREITLREQPAVRRPAEEITLREQPMPRRPSSEVTIRGHVPPFPREEPPPARALDGPEEVTQIQEFPRTAPRELSTQPALPALALEQPLRQSTPSQEDLQLAHRDLPTQPALPPDLSEEPLTQEFEPITVSDVRPSPSAGETSSEDESLIPTEVPIAAA